MAISWRSDLLEPCIIKEDEVLWVAVDDRIAALTDHGQVVFSLAVQSPVLSLMRCAGGVLIIAELQGLIINSDYSVRSIVDFPQIPQDYTLSGNQLITRFIGGESMTFREDSSV